MFTSFYIIYLWNSGQLRNSWILFKKFFKKRKDENGYFFFKTGEFLLILWLYFCICLNSFGLLLFPDYMRDGNSIPPFVCGLIYQSGLWFLNWFTNDRYRKHVKTTNNTISSVIRMKRQNFCTIPHVICYFIINSLYKKLDRFAFPPDTRHRLEIFFHPKIMTFIDYKFWDFYTIFGSATSVIIFFLFMFLVFFLSFLYVISTWLICHIITSKIITHNYNDFVYRKYDRYWFGDHFTNWNKIKFEDIYPEDYTWFQRWFNHIYWFNLMESYIAKFDYRVEKFFYDYRHCHIYVAFIGLLIVYFSPEFYDYV